MSASPTLFLAAVLALAACSRSEIDVPDGDVTMMMNPPVCSGGPQLGDPSCKTCWDHDVVVADDGKNKAYLPICGNTNCVPIVASGHVAPSYAAPESACDLVPPSVTAMCPPPFDCACLGPLLSQYKVWPPTQWNCSWICAQEDGGVRLWCSVP